jgi:hypothetical protein
MTAGGEAALLTFEKEQKVMKKLKKLQKKGSGADASGELCAQTANACAHCRLVGLCAPQRAEPATSVLGRCMKVTRQTPVAAWFGFSSMHGSFDCFLPMLFWQLVSSCLAGPAAARFPTGCS